MEIKIRKICDSVKNFFYRNCRKRVFIDRSGTVLVNEEGSPWTWLTPQGPFAATVRIGGDHLHSDIGASPFPRPGPLYFYEVLRSVKKHFPLYELKMSHISHGSRRNTLQNIHNTGRGSAGCFFWLLLLC